MDVLRRGGASASRRLAGALVAASLAAAPLPSAASTGCTMDSKSAYEAARAAAVEKYGSQPRLKPLLMPEYGTAQVAVSAAGPCRFDVRFIAGSPLDFAHRISATVEQDRASGQWRVAAIDISGRISQFSRP